ncbi:diaminopimelate decarboxylase [Nitratiruptor sp. SB155-2]|uniref:diaminopimelate decarboxylase n=1 Tax=Nitratiruptor sp. (strain SB155-2) TaxID=387092 RepID=UPI0001586E9A|nr:diaminopimelate decarboxylase [Nitratiruptor sp. SB155-2]BAF69501.1 diaminopimelate decarboxylase [Nitratiruptor sp. SB155-2]
MDYIALAQKYDTPLYVYDFNEVAKNYEAIKEAFKARKSIIAYAVKANSNMSLLKHLAELGSGADCVSIGEVKRALLAGIPNYKIIFSGVGKRDDEIEEALLKDILYINIESEAETYRVEEIAKKLGKVARVSFRVNPNIDPKTHPYISTGLHENKFGVEIETAKKLYLYAKNSPFINPVAIHFHIGSQLTELEPIKEASAIVADLVRSLQKLDIDIKFFDVGGGLGIRYKDEKTIEPYDYAQAILSTLRGTDMTIVCEPGRYIVGNAGVFLTKVLYEKQSDKKRFVIVDGAMNDLLRPSLYNAYHEVEVVGKSGNESLADVVGPVCESGDFLAKNRMLPPTKHGDVIVVKSAGAYGFVMASNYNTRPRPAEVAIENGEDRLIRERESFEYIIEKEIRFMV